MRSLLRDLTYVSCLLVVALVFALACQSPFVQASSTHAPLQAQPHQLGHLMSELMSKFTPN